MLVQKFPEAFALASSGFCRNFIKSRNFKKLGIFGFDFMADNNNRLWLLEANHGPCFPVSEDHPLQKYLYQEFWEDFVEGFIAPIAEGNLTRENAQVRMKTKKWVCVC